ncbi:hypothetical protein FHL15_008504 [Xylaria flabelliformis]|uniref:Uncharacterized protein n=1 Tax=Xylaria flabelliformis TaxID=2512241 RepID=A0A553HRH5_9PEZI|nr:hypothetical protein FHL15_008504 [Xylaria flabelliformis]
MSTSKEYDPITGQVFHQWNVPVPDIMSNSWNRICIPQNFIIRIPPNHSSVSRGPAPLVDMCLRAAIPHINEIEKAHLQDLPTRLVGRIWKDLKRFRAPSVETWKLIVTRFAGDEKAAPYYCPLLMRYLTSFKKTQPLAAYIEPLISNTFDFLAHLTITGNIKGNTPELLQLIQLKNLAVLEFIQPDEEDSLASPKLTDSILREWSRTPDPFPVLRVLRIWANDYVTRHSLRYINAFPSLVLYNVAGKKRDWAMKSEEPGWKFEKQQWTRRLDIALSESFHLLQDGIPDDRWKLDTQFTTMLELFQEFFCLEAGIAVFSRENYEAKLTKEPNIMPASTPFEIIFSDSLWGFFIYSHIGRLISDRDLIAQGLDLSENASINGSYFIYSPRPMLHLVLTDENHDHEWQTDGEYRFTDPFIIRGFETHLSFIRKDYHLSKKRASGSTTATGSESAKRAPAVPSPTHRPLKKRRDISSILESFNNT